MVYRQTNTFFRKCNLRISHIYSRNYSDYSNKLNMLSKATRCQKNRINKIFMHSFHNALYACLFLYTCYFAIYASIYYLYTTIQSYNTRFYFSFVRLARFTFDFIFFLFSSSRKGTFDSERRVTSVRAYTTTRKTANSVQKCIW